MKLKEYDLMFMQYQDELALRQQDYELKYKQYQDDVYFKQQDYDLRSKEFSLKTDLAEFNKMLDSLKYSFDIEKFEKEYALKQNAQNFDAEKFSFDIERFYKEYDMKQQQYSMDNAFRQQQSGISQAQWERELALKELIHQSSLTQAEKDYALKYLNVGTAASSLPVDNTNANVVKSSYIDIVDPMVPLAGNTMTLTPQYAFASSNAPWGLRDPSQATSANMLSQDSTEFGKGSYAYYYINTLQDMYNKETNVYKKEQLAKQIKEMETKYRSQTSSTKLSGIPEFWFDKDNIQGIWTSSIDAKQRIFGYTDSYDAAFNVGTDMNALKIEFQFEKNNYRLEFWKADYKFGVDMGMGGEIGFYSRPVRSSYIDKNVNERWEAVNKSDFLNMSFSLYDRSNAKNDSDSGNLIFSRYPQDHWWLTGFKPDAPKVKAEELYMGGEVSFPTELMKQKFVEAFDNKKEKDKKGMTIRVSTIDPTKIYFYWKTN